MYVLVYCVYICMYRDFTSKLTSHSYKVGMSMTAPCTVEFQQPRQPAEQLFKRLIQNNPHLELIMAILPKKGTGSGYGK